MYDKMICKANGQEHQGKLISKVKKCVKFDGSLIDYWLFEVTFDGKLETWECHSDYWDLIDSQLQKTSKALRINESQELNVLDKLKNILKWGFCKWD